MQDQASFVPTVKAILSLQQPTLFPSTTSFGLRTQQASKKRRWNISLTFTPLFSNFLFASPVSTSLSLVSPSLAPHLSFLSDFSPAALFDSISIKCPLTETDTAQNKKLKKLQYARDYYQKNREKKLQYLNEYYKKNRDTRLLHMRDYFQKRRAKIREYRQKNSEKIAEYRKTNSEKMRDYKKNNREKSRQHCKTYYEKHTEKIRRSRQENREYYHVYYKKNQDKRLRHMQEYFQKNREKILAYQKEYRIRKSESLGLPPPKKYSSWKSTDDVRNFFEKFSEVHFIKSWPEDWYRVSLKQVELAGGKDFSFTSLLCLSSSSLLSCPCIPLAASHLSSRLPLLPPTSCLRPPPSCLIASFPPSLLLPPTSAPYSATSFFCKPHLTKNRSKPRDEVQKSGKISSGCLSRD
jgi:hypothetical protein